MGLMVWCKDTGKWTRRFPTLTSCRRRGNRVDAVRMSLWGWICCTGSSEEPAPPRGHLSRDPDDTKKPAWEWERNSKWQVPRLSGRGEIATFMSQGEGPQGWSAVSERERGWKDRRSESHRQGRAEEGNMRLCWVCIHSEILVPSPPTALPLWLVITGTRWVSHPEPVASLGPVVCRGVDFSVPLLLIASSCVSFWGDSPQAPGVSLPPDRSVWLAVKTFSRDP